MKVKEGDQIPDAKVFVLEKDPKEISIKQITGEEKCILFGLPGAFTPTCSMKHLPGFINAENQIKEKNIKKVICISVNDPFVMNAWGKANNTENKILMVADSNCNFTKSIGAEINLNHRGLGIRSSRYAMLVEKGKIIKISNEEVAGKCEATAAENFLRNI
tara:strand:- start:408 stop:890 length:483 start_codon:yes stop_codon:yes gene_type:complete